MTTLLIQFIIVSCVLLFMKWLQKNRGVAVTTSTPTRKTLFKLVDRVEISSTLAVAIFESPPGAFGFCYLHYNSEDASWTRPPTFGSGSLYDTAVKAEEYARHGARHMS